MEKERLRDFRRGERDRKGNKGRVGEKGEKARDTMTSNHASTRAISYPSRQRRQLANSKTSISQYVKAAPLYSEREPLVPALSRSIRDFSTAINPRSVPLSSGIHLSRQSFFFLVPPVERQHIKIPRFREGPRDRGEFVHKFGRLSVRGGRATNNKARNVRG